MPIVSDIDSPLNTLLNTLDMSSKFLVSYFRSFGDTWARLKKCNECKTLGLNNKNDIVIRKLGPIKIILL